MILSGITPVRYYSDLNGWMDCVVFVPNEWAKSIIPDITLAIIKFEEWDCFDSYTDAIHQELGRIPHIIVSIPWDDENDCPKDNDAWESWLDELRPKMLTC